MNRLTPKAAAVILGHKEAYEAMGEYDKAAEVERDIAALKQLGDKLNMTFRHESEPGLIRQRRADLQVRQCEHCGTEYQPYQNNQKYCSRRCHVAASNARHWASAKARGWKRRDRS